MEIRLQISGGEILINGEMVSDVVVDVLVRDFYKKLQVLSPSIFELPLSDTSPSEVTKTFSLEVDPSVSSSGKPSSKTSPLKRSTKKKCVSTNEAPSDSTKHEQVIQLYNDYAKKNKWVRCTKLTDELKKRLAKALKQFPELSDWEVILKGWEAHHFFSGKSGQYSSIKIHTMLYSSRYEEFYNDGVALSEKQNDHDDFFAQLNNPKNYSSFRVPNAD